MKVRKVGLFLAAILLLGPLLSLMNFPSLDMTMRVLVVLQITASTYFLYAAIKYREGDGTAANRYIFACCGVLAFVCIFSVSFIIRNISVISDAPAFAIMFLITPALFSAPFIWCIRKVSFAKGS